MAKSRAESLFEDIKAGGLARLRQLIFEDKLPENEFFDLKGRKEAGRLVENERNKLSQAFSGFSNSSGGVLIYGIDKKDGQPAHDCPFPEIASFEESVHDSTNFLTNPPAQIQSFRIEAEGEKGYVVILVEESFRKPHQALDKKYYIRSGASHGAAEHEWIAAMFRAKTASTFTVSLDCRKKFDLPRVDSGTLTWSITLPLVVDVERGMPNLIGIAIPDSIGRLSPANDLMFERASTSPPIQVGDQYGSKWTICLFKTNLLEGMQIEVAYLQLKIERSIRSSLPVDCWNEIEDCLKVSVPMMIFGGSVPVYHVLEESIHVKSYHAPL